MTEVGKPLTEEQQAGTTPETMSEANAPEVVSVAEPATTVADVAAETPEPSTIEPPTKDVAAVEAVAVAEPAAEPEAEAVAEPEAAAEPGAEAAPAVVPEPEPVAEACLL